MANVSKEVLERQPAAILGRAIQKAIDGGWDAWGWPDFAVWGEDTVMFFDQMQEADPKKMVQHGNEVEFPTIIFNHDFARAVFGDAGYVVVGQYKTRKSVEINKPDRNPISSWQYHLQQLVIADDPIKYLADNI